MLRPRSRRGAGAPVPPQRHVENEIGSRSLMVPGEGRAGWLGFGDALGPPLDGDREASS